MPDAVRFHRSLYDVAAIEAAAQAYEPLANITLHVSEHDVRADIADIDERVADRLVDAFCNHALFTTISQRRQVLP